MLGRLTRLFYTPDMLSPTIGFSITKIGSTYLVIPGFSRFAFGLKFGKSPGEELSDAVIRRRHR